MIIFLVGNRPQNPYSMTGGARSVQIYQAGALPRGLVSGVCVLIQSFVPINTVCPLVILCKSLSPHKNMDTVTSVPVTCFGNLPHPLRYGRVVFKVSLSQLNTVRRNKIAEHAFHLDVR